LVGVTVHGGTAEFGHYYSYINVNRGNKENIRDPSKDKWLEFNDSMIKDYDCENIPKDCFGGKMKTNAQTFNLWGNSEKSTNAYILVYDKIVKANLELVYKTPL
jgi:hypothetical protein